MFRDHYDAEHEQPEKSLQFIKRRLAVKKTVQRHGMVMMLVVPTLTRPTLMRLGGDQSHELLLTSGT